MSSLHDRLQKIRREKKLSQTELANQVGLSLRTYQYYERGERPPTAPVIITLADYLNCSVDYLLGRTDNPEVNK